MAENNVRDKVASGVKKSGSCEHENSQRISDAYDVVLHIGAPKTGSSALQAFCLNNRDLLSQAGFYYPVHGRDMNDISGGHSNFGKALIDNDIDSAKNILDEWMLERRSSQLCLLISAESLYNQSSRLKKILSKYRVLVISYFRDPIEAIVSNYNQVVKRHFETAFLESYIKLEINSNSPGVSGKIYDVWFDDFGSQNLIVYPYASSAFPQEKIELSFLEILGVPDLLAAEFEIETRLINASYSLPSLELKRLFNLVLSNDDFSLSLRVDRCLQGYSDAGDSCSLSKYEQIGNELYNLLIRKFNPTNDYIKENILLDYPKGFLEYEILCQKAGAQRIVSFQSLEKVMNEAFVDDFDLIDALRKLTLRRVSSGCLNNASLHKLVDLLGISDEGVGFFDVDFKEVVFDSRQMSVFLSDKSSEADLLREISIMLERCGQYEQAFQTICRAVELRPTGPKIVAMHDRLKKHLDMD